MKVSIYATPDLWERMQAVEPAPNWSKVFARAAEQELAAITARKGKHDMESAIQRLRASKLTSESEQYVKGSAAGARWAREHAEWPQLERLDRVDDDYFDDPEAWEHTALGVSGEVFGFISGDTVDRTDSEDFWRGWADDEPYPDFDFVQGFYAGAMEFFNEAKDLM